MKRIITHYLHLFKLHNRPWSLTEIKAFVILMMITGVICIGLVMCKKIKVYQAAAIIIFVICMCFLYATTLFTREEYGIRQFRCALKDDWRLLLNGVQSEWDQITLNIILFIPFGFFWDIIRRNKSNYIEIILMSAVLSLSVEIMQYYSTRGTFDIEDLLTNVIGGIIGGIVIKLLFFLGRKLYFNWHSAIL